MAAQTDTPGIAQTIASNLGQTGPGTSTLPKSNPIDPTTINAAAARALGHNPDAQQYTKDYNGVFTKGYQLLNQSVGPNEPTAIAANGANELAKNFIANYTQQNNGQMPTDDMVKNYVGSTLTPEVASKFITGSMAPGAQNTMAQQWLQSNASGNNPLTNPKSPITDTMYGDLNTAIGNALQGSFQNINDQYSTAKNQALDSAAAYGNMSNPNLYAQGGAISNLDKEKFRAISDAIRTIQGQGAQTAFGAEQNMRQFGAQNQLANRQVDLGQTNFQNALDYQQLNDMLSRQTAMKLGQMQADASKPGIMDYLNTAFGGLGALGTLATGASAAKNAFFPSKPGGKA